jgi:hypothetical protein
MAKHSSPQHPVHSGSFFGIGWERPGFVDYRNGVYLFSLCFSGVKRPTASFSFIIHVGFDWTGRVALRLHGVYCLLGLLNPYYFT